MLLWSTQHHIISSIFVSFKNNKKTFTKKVNENILKKDTIFLNPKKFETYSKSNFTFIVLYSMYSNNFSSKVNLLKHLNNLTKDDIKEIFKEKDKIIVYQNTIKNDIEVINDLIYKQKTININIKQLFRNNRISILGIYYYYKKYPVSKVNRIKYKHYLNTNLFMEYFNIIKQYIDDMI